MNISLPWIFLINENKIGLLQRRISGNIGQTLGEELLYAVVGMSWFLTSKVLLWRTKSRKIYNWVNMVNWLSVEPTPWATEPIVGDWWLFWAGDGGNSLMRSSKECLKTNPIEKVKRKTILIITWIPWMTFKNPGEQLHWGYALLTVQR